jgi:hypothetical protein
MVQLVQAACCSGSRGRRSTGGTLYKLLRCACSCRGTSDVPRHASQGPACSESWVDSWTDSTACQSRAGRRLTSGQLALSRCGLHIATDRLARDAAGMCSREGANGRAWNAQRASFWVFQAKQRTALVDAVLPLDSYCPSGVGRCGSATLDWWTAASPACPVRNAAGGAFNRPTLLL